MHLMSLHPNPILMKQPKIELKEKKDFAVENEEG